MSAADTIVAVSSPPGQSARGLIRLAGMDARRVVAALLSPQFVTPPARTLTAVRLASPALPALLTWFAAPHSYTGDDTAELQLPGHPALLDRVLHAAVAAGARLAEPGEFTFRAFTAGKLDLTQAEGVAATIAATSDSQLRAAGLLRAGRLGALAETLVDRLGALLALVEAGIDFTDQEDVVPIGPAALDDGLAAAQTEISNLLSRSRSWGSLEALPRVVLVGPPSAGKSTLFNALLGRTRAVVSALPGTTRDVLAEPLTVSLQTGRRIELMLVDIAGLDAPAAALDRQAQDAARRAIDGADLILHIVDPRQPAAADQPSRPGLPSLRVATKADLAPSPDADLAVSAHTGAGLDALRHALATRLADRGVTVAGDALALQPRHEASLKTALAAISDARHRLAPQRDDHAIGHIELIAGALRAALDALAGLGGQLTPDDVIGRVFATFCVGK